MSNSIKPKKQRVHIGLFLLLIGIICSITLLASVPPVSRDALIQHLQIPKLYLLQGGIYEIPELVFSYYPMNLDLLYMWALHYGNNILPKYIHAAFGLATALLLYHYLKNRLSRTYGLLGAIFFLSIPIIVKLSITVYVDLGLIFFTTASLLLLLQWLEKDCKTLSPYLITAGICCGLAVGTKYNGLLVFFLLSLFIPVLYIRKTGVKGLASAGSLRHTALFCLCALIAASPWLLRNGIWTGNPIYPLYNNFFNPPLTTDIINASNTNNLRGVFATRHFLYGENIWQLLLLPIRIFFQGMDNDPRYFDGRLNPFLLLLPLFAFTSSSRKNRTQKLEKMTLLLFCIFYFLFAFNTGVLRIRYLAPMIPFLVILSMYGLYNIEVLCNRYPARLKWGGVICVLLFGLLFSYNLSYIYLQYKLVDPASYISGRQSRDEYITKHIPEYKVLQYANTNTAASAKILCINMGWRGYYLNRQHVFDYAKNPNLLLAQLQKPNITANEIITLLRKKKISHLLIRTDLFKQWMQQSNPGQQAVWTKLKNNHLSYLTSHLNYALYKIY